MNTTTTMRDAVLRAITSSIESGSSITIRDPGGSSLVALNRLVDAIVEAVKQKMPTFTSLYQHWIGGVRLVGDQQDVEALVRSMDTKATTTLHATGAINLVKSLGYEWDQAASRWRWRAEAADAPAAPKVDLVAALDAELAKTGAASQYSDTKTIIGASAIQADADRRLNDLGHRLSTRMNGLQDDVHRLSAAVDYLNRGLAALEAMAPNLYQRLEDLEAAISRQGTSTNKRSADLEVSVSRLDSNLNSRLRQHAERSDRRLDNLEAWRIDGTQQAAVRADDVERRLLRLEARRP